VPGLKFYTYAIESYNYVDKDGMDLMRALALAASSTGKVKHGSFLASVHRRLVLLFVKGIMPSFVQGCSSTPVPVAMLVFLGVDSFC
jgi:hypothetical protein